MTRPALLFTSFFLPLFLHAQGSSTGVTTLKLPFIARTSSLGDAVVADRSDFSTFLLNPAALNNGSSTQMLFSHLEWIQGVRSNHFAASIPLSLGMLGISVCASSVSGIEVRDKPGPSIASFSSHSTIFALGYGIPLSSDLSGGVTVRYLYEKLFVDEALGFGIDLGLLLTLPFPGTTFGASLNNVGSMNKMRSQSSTLPGSFTLGGTYAAHAEVVAFIISAAFSDEMQGNLRSLHLGIEVGYKEMASLRFGYITGFESRGFSAGLGIHYEQIRFDYGFVPFSFGLGSGHITTISLTW